MSSLSTHQPQWYVLSYLGSHRDALKRLALIECPYFAPEFFAHESARSSRRDYCTFSSYAFVQATQDRIYQLKRDVLRPFNFLPMAQGVDGHHPYVSDETINQLRHVEAANDGKIPYIPYPTDVVIGDTIKILVGQFQGQEARAIKRNGSKYRQIVLDIAGKFIIPLCKLKVGEYEIISFSDKGNKSAGSGVRKEDLAFLNDALKRHYGIGETTDEQRATDEVRTQAIILRYRSLTPTTHLQRIKVATLLVMAYTIVRQTDQQQHYIGHALNLLKDRCTPSQKASAYAMLYACTMKEDYYTSCLAECAAAKEGSKASEDIARYRKWHLMLHPKRTKTTNKA